MKRIGSVRYVGYVIISSIVYSFSTGYRHRSYFQYWEVNFRMLVCAVSTRIIITIWKLKNTILHKSDDWRVLFGENVYLSAHTGFGKSIVFQSVPWFFDLINDQNLDTSTLIVVSPLISLMEDLWRVLLSLLLPFTKKLDDIEDGFYSLVYTSSESMLFKVKLRQLLSSSSFLNHCIDVAVDEAHVMAEWFVFFFSFSFCLYCTTSHH